MFTTGMFRRYEKQAPHLMRKVRSRPLVICLMIASSGVLRRITFPEQHFSFYCIQVFHIRMYSTSYMSPPKTGASKYKFIGALVLALALL